MRRTPLQRRTGLSQRSALERKSAPKRNCEYCGQEFAATQEFHSYSRKYCSSRCTGAAHRKKTLEGYPPREEIVRLYVDEGLSDRALGSRFGHSYQWSLGVRKHYGIPGRPKGNRRPARGARARWGLFMKREECCRNCGSADGQLHLHHAIPRSKCSASKWDLRNGVPLCTRCHLGWHHRRVTLYRDIFTAEEWAYISSVELTGERIEPWLDERYPKRSEEACPATWKAPARGAA